MFNEIQYVFKKLSEDNTAKYNRLLPFFPDITTFLKSPFISSEAFKTFCDSEEYLQLVEHLFKACIFLSKDTINFPNSSSLSSPRSDEELHAKQAEGLSYKSWLTNIKPLNVESKQGTVFTATFLGNEVVVKCPKKTADSNFSMRMLTNTIKEYFVGVKCTNSLRLECPMFVYTYGMFIHKGAHEPWIVTERVHGETLNAILKEDSLSPTQFMDLFCQILIALEIGQRDYKFCHYDLHTNNIIVVKSQKVYSCHVYVYDICVQADFTPVLIDYGMSSVVVEQDIYVGQHNLEKRGIFPFLFPGYDAYVFLLFCREIAAPRIAGVIDSLLRFYGNVDHTDYVTTLKNSAGRQTPLIFLEWVKARYVTSLVFSPRIVAARAFFFKTPTSLLSQAFRNERILDFDLSGWTKMLLDAVTATKSLDSGDEVEAAVNMLYVVKQLGLGTYKEWALKFEKSNLYAEYRERKPISDRNDRLR